LARGRCNGTSDGHTILAGEPSSDSQRVCRSVGEEGTIALSVVELALA
jgi:hypothetical protein